MVANLIKALLSFVPFFAVFIYFKVPYLPLVIYAFFLFTLELSRGLIKDVVGLKGDVVFGYPTVPARSGNPGLRRHLLVINILSWLMVAWYTFSVGQSQATLLFFGSMLLLQLFTAWKLPLWVDRRIAVRSLHLVYKLALVVGVGLLIRI